MRLKNAQTLHFLEDNRKMQRSTPLARRLPAELPALRPGGRFASFDCHAKNSGTGWKNNAISFVNTAVN
ncbi:MAG: hypothetical protein JSS81_11920 [Acidobacteria bacterium]|nr:hypothetical protein [Acidobacteriota bacterium]